MLLPSSPPRLFGIRYKIIIPSQLTLCNATHERIVVLSLQNSPKEACVAERLRLFARSRHQARAEKVQQARSQAIPGHRTRVNHGGSECKNWNCTRLSDFPNVRELFPRELVVGLPVRVFHACPIIQPGRTSITNNSSAGLTKALAFVFQRHAPHLATRFYAPAGTNRPRWRGAIIFSSVSRNRCTL